MHDLNGYEVARRLRDMPYPPELIIAVSGYGMSHDKDKAAAAGIAHYLVKPVKIAEVTALIEGAPAPAAAGAA
jgi:CheY-like chemotaxis protein